MSYFTEPQTHSEDKIEDELVLPNYATKIDLKNATGVDTSGFAPNQISINQIFRN